MSRPLPLPDQILINACVVICAGSERGPQTERILRVIEEVSPQVDRSWAPMGRLATIAADLIRFERGLYAGPDLGALWCRANLDARDALGQIFRDRCLRAFDFWKSQAEVSHPQTKEAV